MGTPEVTTLVDTVRSWRVGIPFRELAAWVAKHRPRGLPETGTSSQSDQGGSQMTGFDYGSNPGPAWQSAELEIAVAPAGPQASVMRADGVVVYYDPRPVPDNQAGPRLRVTLAGGCPGSDAGIVGVRNGGQSDLRHRLLPASRPSAALVCRYDGMNGKAFRLVRASRLGAAAAGRLARQMAGFRFSHVDATMINCPFDDDSYKVVALAYPHRPDVDLWVKLNGCTFVANGFVIAGLGD
jgi:hypothetical protein